MTATKRTSAEVAALAAKYLRLDDEGIVHGMVHHPNDVITDLRTLAASCLSQDEASAGSKRVYNSEHARKHERVLLLLKDFDERTPIGWFLADHVKKGGVIETGAWWVHDGVAGGHFIAFDNPMILDWHALPEVGV